MYSIDFLYKVIYKTTPAGYFPWKVPGFLWVPVWVPVTFGPKVTGTRRNRMMKNRKTLFLDALRNIINRKVAFLSIIAIMMLGVGGLMCIFNLGESLNKHSNRF